MPDDTTGFRPLAQLIKEDVKVANLRDATKGKEQEARARLIAADRLISGSSVADLAKSYGIGHKGVINALSLAERTGFYEDVEAIIASRLVSKAIAVYEMHLDRGSLEAARDVAFGVGALRKNADIAVNVNKGDDINNYRVQREALASVEVK